MFEILFAMFVIYLIFWIRYMARQTREEVERDEIEG